MKTTTEQATQAKRLMMHGKDYDGGDVTGWHVSEKMDGCRAYWDGLTLYTKEGNTINAPHITETLPAGVHLDGEIWAGRGQFEAARLFTQYGKNPDRVQFVAFDAPGAAGDWPQRLQAAQAHGVQTVKAWRVESLAQLLQDTARMIGEGAEGVMVRLPGRPYKPCRSRLIMKIKPHSLALLADTASTPECAEH